MTDPTEPTTPADEAKLITRLVALLDKVDRQVQVRAVRWAAERYAETGGQT